MPRVIWKGAITFGLVHVPVALYPASQEVGIDFDWLDKRSMDPVGYKRVNKRTGKDIQSDDIVKGIKQDDGDYVILNEDQTKAAYPKSTQTIEIEGRSRRDRHGDDARRCACGGGNEQRRRPHGLAGEESGQTQARE
jgi:Ku protein